MSKIKLTTALKAAAEALTNTQLRDTTDALNPKNEDSILKHDFKNHSSLTYQIESMIDDNGANETYINVVLWLSETVDKQQYLDYTYIDELTAQLNALSKDDYLEDNLNPRIIRLYTEKLVESWNKIDPKQDEIKDINSATSAILSNKMAQLNTKNALLVASFIDSLKN